VEEIVPGIRHWSAFHEGIRFDVSSHWAVDARALIDPMVPPEGLGALDGLPEPEVILLTNRHHLRHSARFVERFGCTIRCHSSGLHEFEGRQEEVEGFEFGDEVAPGIVALEMDAICPDDAVLRIDAGGGALSFADSVIHWGGGKIGFVPDRYMDDPPRVKEGIRASVRRLLEREGFGSLLFAHGEPIVGEGRNALRTLVEGERDK
jgi:hypothetical protein